MRHWVKLNEHDQALALPGIINGKYGKHGVPDHAFPCLTTHYPGKQLTNEEAMALGQGALDSLKARGLWSPDAGMVSYQLLALGLALHRGRFHLWLPAGAGKTRVALAWALSQVQDTTVWVTRTMATFNVAGEVDKVAPSTQTFIWKPPSRRRKKDTSMADWMKQTEGTKRVIILGWDNLVAAVDDILPHVPYLLVFDEVHRGQSHDRWNRIIEPGSSKPVYRLKQNQAASAHRLSKASTLTLGLTATPIPDRIRGLWGQLDLVDPEEWGKYWDWAARYTGLYEGQYGRDDTGSSNLEELSDRVGFCSLRVAMEEVRQGLPGLAREQQVIPKGMLGKVNPAVAKEAKAAMQDADPDTILGVRMSTLASMKNGYVIDMVADLLKSDQKVLVFTGFCADANAIYQGLLEEMVTQGPGTYLRVAHAQIATPEERFEMAEKYMAHPGPACLVATGASMGESLNLQDTDVLLIPVIPWSPVHLEQWEGRAIRRGQKRRTRIIYLFAEGTDDARVFDIVRSKLEVAADIVQDDDLRGMASVLEHKINLTDEDLASIVLASLGDFNLMDTFLEED